MIWQETGLETLRAGIRADMHAELKALDHNLSDRIHQVDRHVGDAKSDLVRWSFVFWVGAVTAVAALAGVLGRP